MKLSILFVGSFGLLLMGIGSLWADPGDFFCRGALTRLTQAQQLIQVKEGEVQQAKSATKVAFAELEVCKLGTIVNGVTVRDCVKHRIDAPRKIRDLAEVEIELQDAIHKFQTGFEQMSRVCFEPGNQYVNTGRPVYP